MTLKDILSFGMGLGLSFSKPKKLRKKSGKFEITKWNFDKKSSPRNADRGFNGTTLIKKGFLKDKEYSVNHIVRQGDYGGPKRRRVFFFAFNPLGVNCSQRNSGEEITLDMSYQEFESLYKEKAREFECDYKFYS